MTKKEFSQLSIGMKAAYPRFQMLATDEEMSFWYQMLKDIPYEVAENAVMEHICTNVFPPNIAEIRKLCMERCKQPILDFDEAWGVVQRAISAHGRYHPEKAFAEMDELTLSVVNNLGWTNLCQSENPVADRANFREAYMDRAKALQGRNQLPDFIAAGKERLKEQYIPKLEAQEGQQTGRRIFNLPGG